MKKLSKKEVKPYSIANPFLGTRGLSSQSQWTADISMTLCDIIFMLRYSMKTTISFGKVILRKGF